MHKETFEREQVVEIVEQAVKQAMPAPAPACKDLIKKLAKVTEIMCTELGKTGPGHILGLLPDILAELDAIRASTEQAANTIMSECEKQNPNTTKILEACTFQDMTGQRTQKIEKTINQIDDCASKIADILRMRFADLKSLNILPADEGKGDGDGKTDADLMNGPQLPDQALSQEEIDKLLDSF